MVDDYLRFEISKLRARRVVFWHAEARRRKEQGRGIGDG